MNVVKRIIKRRVWKSFGTCTTEADAAYRWVIDAPITQWSTRIWCVRHRGGEGYENLYEWIKSA